VDPALHPDVAPLACLLGTWSGTGSGEYPTISPFEYREEITFAHVGKPFLAYRQSTVRLDTGLPAHAEVGYFRGVGAGRIELVLAHPTGIMELSEGTVDPTTDGLALRLVSTQIPRTPTAKEVTAVTREITVAADALRYDISMSAVGHPLTHHLTARLHRVG
jgi:hypothetical protein